LRHAYLGLAAFDLLAGAVGYALLYGLGLVRRRGHVLLQLGLAFFTGWAALGVVLALGVSLGVDPAVRNVLLLAVGVAALGIAARRVFPELARPSQPREQRPLLRAAALAGAALLVVGLVATICGSARGDAEDGWDLFAMWLPKAEAIYYFHGLDTGLSGYLTYGHNEYPPLMPAITAGTFHFMGAVHQSILPLQASLLSIAFIASLVALLLPRVPRWILFPLLAMLVLAPDFWHRMPGVMPDQTVAYLLALAAIACVLWLEEGRTAWLVLGTLFLAGASLSKAEGFMLAALLAAVVAVSGFAARGRRAYPVLLLALGPASVEVWHGWLAAHHQRTSPPEYSWSDLLHPGYLADRLDRLGFAAHKMLLLFDPQYWSFLVPLALVVLIVVAPTVRAPTTAILAWLVVGYFGLATVYWIGSLEIHFWVSTSAHRVADALPIVAGSVLPLLLGLALERRSALEAGV
jgi:hypothetical protein